MELIAPTDSVFLMGESREHPMHVGGLMLFEPPEGAGREFVGEIYHAMLAQRDLQPTFRKHPATILGGISNVGWTYDADADIDIDYHLRRSALPVPGRVRDLLEMTSRLHGSLLDRHRPLWEAHLVEGLNDGRFAVYVKIHHALTDGVSLLRLIQRTLSDDPRDPDLRVPWALPPRPRAPSSAVSRLQELAGFAKAVVAAGPSAVSLARAALLEQRLTLPFEAPGTMFNVRIGGARRCAAQSWPVKRFKKIKLAAGVTINDVVLAMCAGALRYYLDEQHALPERPLVAMVPVSLRTEAESDSGGNRVGTILCNLGTHLDDPAARLATISESMRRNKKVFTELPRAQALALSALNMAPLALAAAIPGLVSTTRPPFNIVISNVPGPAEPMYWRGARLDGNYPMSIALDWLALNITVVSNAGNLDFGLVGCRRSVPHLQRLLAHLHTALEDLESALGI
ncbi:MAG TPA: wax ester/triacylglycerol synthase family O-acyltransferase [Mycobacterium sp.]|nr:wax ester/triacylglycerol synthase family O-acyltransferase [Mycobacterium sp.]